MPKQMCSDTRYLKARNKNGYCEHNRARLSARSPLPCAQCQNAVSRLHRQPLAPTAQLAACPPIPKKRATGLTACKDPTRERPAGCFPSTNHGHCHCRYHLQSNYHYHCNYHCNYHYHYYHHCNYYYHYYHHCNYHCKYHYDYDYPCHLP